MAGFFYAYATPASARQSRPAWFEQDEDGNWCLVGGRMEYATNGLPLTEAVLSEQDEEGNQTLITPSEMSAPYVILSPQEDGSPTKLIAPFGHGGFS